MEFPQLSELKPGDRLVADGGFTCLREGEVVTVEQDADGLFVRCCADDNGDHGKPANDERNDRHGLDGQEGERGECVGLSRWAARVLSADEVRDLHQDAVATSQEAKRLISNQARNADGR